MSVFSTTEIKKRSTQEEREVKRLEKIAYKDLRWAIDRYPITPAEWQTLLTLHSRHGKEGGRQLAHELIPSWSLRQESMDGGCPCPADLWKQWKPEAIGKRASTRKVRIDAGKARKSTQRSSKK